MPGASDATFCWSDRTSKMSRGVDKQQLCCNFRDSNLLDALHD